MQCPVRPLIRSDCPTFTPDCPNQLPIECNLIKVRINIDLEWRAVSSWDVRGSGLMGWSLRACSKHRIVLNSDVLAFTWASLLLSTTVYSVQNKYRSIGAYIENFV